MNKKEVSKDLKKNFPLTISQARDMISRWEF